MRFIRSAALVAALGAAWACGGDDGPTETEDPTQIRVTVQTDGAADAGVTVGLFASGGTTALNQLVTNANGQVTFTQLDQGTYDVEVQVPLDLELGANESARKSATVAEGATANVTFQLATASTGNVTVVTLNAATFSPAAVTIDVGEMVRWVNGQPISHTITPDGHSEWSSQSVSADGETFEHTFQTAGSYPYLCQVHAGMTGTVTVN